MKRNIYALTFYAAIALCFSCGQRPLGEHIGVTTYSYAVKDGDTLHMDVYLDSTKLHADEKLPVFLFSFGGGWTSGKRQDGQALLEDAAHHGYVGVGIDYRLGIRALSKQGVNIDSTNFASSYSMAITWGIEDLFDATCFVIDHADELHADTCRIIACGSSAGATNSLTAEYLISTHDSLAASRLPQGFNYAAIVPFAGGVWLAGTDTLVWQRTPCPVLAYHGTDDQLVPYNKVLVQQGAFGGFGPGYYMPQLREMQVPSLFHTYQGGDHMISALGSSPDARAEMFSTLDRLVMRGSKATITITDEYFGVPPTFGNFKETLVDLNIK